MSSHRTCPPLEHGEEPQTLDGGDSHLREEVERLTAALQAANTRLDELVTLDALTPASSGTSRRGSSRPWGRASSTSPRAIT